MRGPVGGSVRMGNTLGYVLEGGGGRCCVFSMLNPIAILPDPLETSREVLREVNYCHPG